MEFEMGQYQYKQFRISFWLDIQEEMWTVGYGYGSEKQTICTDATKNGCLLKFKKWFRQLVDHGDVFLFRKQSQRVSFQWESVLKTVRQERIGYHVTKTENVPRILKEGLRPNGQEDSSTRKASQILDQVKPSRIPVWVQRELCVYAHPEIENEQLTEHEFSYKNSALFALELQASHCWMGSIGLGGFCLFLEDWTLEQEQKFVEHLVEKDGDAQHYWEASCSLVDYIHKTSFFQKQDREWGIDEILVMHSLPSSKLTWIGQWDEHGTFHQNENFIHFIKDKYKTTYVDILSKY